MLNFEKINQMAHDIREIVLELTIEKNGCYLSQALSSADIFATLYGGLLKLGKSQAPYIAKPFSGVPGALGYTTGADYNGPREAGYDRLLISPAHYAVAVYASLVVSGRMSKESFKSFNVDGSSVEQIGAEHSPGFELTTGSFGQAVSQAGGIAMARKLKSQLGDVVVFMSDGELEEGQTWEAIQAAVFYQLDNLKVIVDVNGQQYDGNTKDVMCIEPIDARITGFGATCIKVNGHSPKEIVEAFKKTTTGPLFILAYTDTTKGIPELNHRKPHLHFVRPKENELSILKNVLSDMKEGVR